MSADLFEFSNRVGADLTEFLNERVKAELSQVSNQDRLTAMLGATLVAVANVLRDPVEGGWSADKAVSFCSKWLKELLEPVAGGSDR
jgi:hypothetical protein